MPQTVPCPHCGKSLKLLDSVGGKTIRCPSCQQTFKASPATSKEKTPEVLPAAAVADTLQEAPVPDVLPGDAGKASRKTAPAGNGRAIGVVLGILAVVLVLCGGLGTLVLVVGTAIMNSKQPTTANAPPVAHSPPPLQPNPNPQPNPKPNPTPIPAKDELRRVGDRLTIHTRGTRMVRTLPDGKRLAAVGEDGVVNLLELPGFGSDPMVYRLAQTLPAVEGPICRLAFHPSSQMAIVAGDRVQVYNDDTGELIASLPFKEPIAAVFQPAGLHLAIAVRKPDGQGSEVHLWDTRQKRLNGKPLTLAGKVSDLAWPSGTYNLAVAVDGEVRLYLTPDRDWRYYHTIATGQGSITGLAFTQHGQSLATIGSDRTIKLWTQKDGKLLRTYEGATNPMGWPAFTPDGAWLAVLGGPGDDRVHLWRTATGMPHETLALAPAQGGNLDFLRDNQTLVIALRNQPIRFWSIPKAAVPVKPAAPPRPGKPESPKASSRGLEGSSLSNSAP